MEEVSWAAIQGTLKKVMKGAQRPEYSGSHPQVSTSPSQLPLELSGPLYVARDMVATCRTMLHGFD